MTPDGGEHNLYPLNCSAGYSGITHNHDYLLGYCRDNPYSSGPVKGYYTADGTYISATITPSANGPTWTLYLPDGTQVIQSGDGIQRIRDTNGNSIKIFSDNSGGEVYRDEQTGREIKLTYSSAGNNGHGQYQAWYQTVGGAWQHIDINMKTTQVKGLIYNTTDWNPEGSENGGGMECTRQAEIGPYLFVVSEIIFPVTEPGQPGQRYSFSYNSEITSQVTSQVQWLCQMPVQPYTRITSAGVGELIRMQTPAGAVVNYTYADWGTESGPLEFPDPTTLARRYVSSKSVTHDNTTDTWNYELSWNDGGGSVQSPDGATMVETAYPHDPAYSHYFGMSGKSGLVYRTVQSGQIMIERHWTLMPFSNAQLLSPGSPTDRIPFNPVVDAEYTSLLNGNGQPVKMSAKTFQYDFNGNLLKTTEYDWFDPSLVTRDTSEQLLLGLPVGVPASATVLRTTNNSYYNSASSASSSSVYAKRPLTLSAPLILNAMSETSTGESRKQFSYDGQAFGVAPATGNPTKVSGWDNVNSQWLSTSIAYDAYGNKSSTTDPRGNVTQFFYEDATHSQPTRVVVDPLNGTGQQTALTAYDYWTGLVVSQTDANGQVSSIDYTNQLLGTVDPFGRPGIVMGPPVGVNGSPQSRRASTIYEDSARRVTMEADLFAEGDRLLKSRTTQDQLNRPILVEGSEDGSSYAISARTVYEQMGRITFSSNPSRAAASATDGWTRSTRDLLGRVVEVATFSGAAQPPSAGTNNNWTGSVTSDYATNVTTVQDQAGKARRSETDALGRLVRVIEDPGGLSYQTGYTYDMLGNLRTVQQGEQTRTFLYDSLSRLTSATNPESGTVLYRYDPNGNLSQKTDARGITTYAYDALNRLTNRSYSNDPANTPTVTYAYDTAGIANAKGRLTSISSSVSQTNYAGYDAMGHVTASSQATNGQTYSMSYEYDLAGNLKSEGYPTGRIIHHTFDSAGRLQSVTGTKGSATSPYASALSYTAHSAMWQMTLGNGLIEQTTFNSRLQPTAIKLGTTASPGEKLQLSYDYGTTANNGNLLSQSISVPGLSQPLVQSYQYDSLNRLTSARETNNGTQSWQQLYDYDRFGNRRFKAGTSLPASPDITQDATLNPSVNPATNRVHSGQGYAYDNGASNSAGNLTSAPGYTFSYDAENRMVTSNDATPNQQVTPNRYVYDGDGRRVKKVTANGQETTVFVYDVMGQLVCEYNNLTPATTSETSYVTSDALGTPRVMTKANGEVKARHDYLPFGEELQARTGGRTTGQGYGANDNVRQKFTGQARDSETGLDYMKARYYSSQQGRFTSTDKPLADQRQTNPQSWNLYAYVRNSPCNNVDPSGRCSVPSGLKAGSVGICIEAFISTPTVFGGGKGDNRGFSGNDKNLSSRVRVDVIITPNTNGTQHIETLTQPGISEAVIPHNNSTTFDPNDVTIIGRRGSASTSITNAITEENGTSTFTITTTAKNGFQDVPLIGSTAPQGTIDLKLDFVVTADNKVGIAEGSERRNYPSYAVYSYRYENGKLITTEIRELPEGKLEDLTRPMVPIPPVNPR